MKKNRKKNIIGGSVIILMIVAMVGYYLFLSAREKTNEEINVKATKVQEAIMRDLDKNYPPTPKEIVIFYSEITKCFYNEEYTDKELEQLTEQVRGLLDEELLEQNEWVDHLINLRSEIADYKKNEVTISSFQVSNSTEVEYYNKDGEEMAQLYCTYTLRQGRTKQDLMEVFILRKDANERWKILGWDVVE